MKFFYENVKNQKLYKNIYWGQFQIDENNKYDDFKEIFENRDKFKDEYNIIKNEQKTKLINDYFEYLRKKNIKLDHTEVYKDNEKNYIIVNSPYTELENIDGFNKIYNLYGFGANTFIKKITRKEIRNEMNGEIKKEKNKQYMNNFYKKVKEEKYECPICHGNFTYFNKSLHIKTKRHLKFLEMQNK